MKYDLNYFYGVIKECEYDEEYIVYKENEEVLNVTLLYERDFEFRTKDTKVLHFAPIIIQSLSFSKNLISFAYEGKRIPSVISYNNIVNVVVKKEGTLEKGCEYNFIIELDDGMVIKF